MNLFYTIAGIALLVILAFQDFRERKISWFLLPLLFFSLVLSGIESLSLKQLLAYFSVNFGFIVLQITSLTIYFSIKKRKFTNIINQYIGIGDLLFFVVLCAAFSPVNFIFFYCTCLLISLVWVLFYHFAVRKEIKEIPLAGIFSILLIFILAINNFSPAINFYDDKFILSIFI